MGYKRSFSLGIRFGLPCATGILCGYIIYFLLIAPPPGYPKSMDFLSWYAAGKMVIDGKEAEIYKLQSQIAYQTPISFPYEPSGGALIYNRPPFFVIPILFLSSLPYNWAYLIWVLIMLVAGGLSVVLLTKYIYPIQTPQLMDYVLYIVFGLAFFPVFQSILLGQTSLLELLILIGIYQAYRKGHNILAGTIAGLAAFKPQFVLVILFLFIIRYSWRALSILISVIGLQGLAGISLVGIQGTFEYFQLTRDVYFMNCTYGVYPEYHQSWRGLLIGLMLPACESGNYTTNLTEVFNNANELANVLSLITMTLLLLAFYVWRKKPVDSPFFDLLFVLFILASLLGSPYSNPQEMTRLILAAALLLRIREQAGELLPRKFSIQAVILIFILLGPLTMTPAANRLHPLTIAMIIIFSILYIHFLRVALGRKSSERTMVVNNSV